MSSTKKTAIRDNNNKNEPKYELLPPEGGWGYVIAAAVTLMVNVTCQTMCGFGLIFGNFLSSIGDETTGTTLANGIFNTIFSFTGLASNHLLQKYSYRTVGILGAIIYFIGSFSTIFATNLFQIVLTFGVLQGIGYGLQLPAVYSAFNCYFDKKMNLMMGLSQAFMVAMQIVVPSVAKMSMDTYGFRGTVALLAALSLNCFPAVFSLQPVKWHLLKKPLDNEENIEVTLNPIKFEEENRAAYQSQPLLQMTGSRYLKYVAPKQRTSIVTAGDRSLMVSTVSIAPIKSEENLSTWQTIVKSMDLKMFKDSKYINITVGLSLSYTADVAFISILPLNLYNNGLDSSQIANIMTIYFVSDFISRLLLSFVGGVLKIKNRYIFLVGSLLSGVFRCAFIMYDTYMWKLSICTILGFLRCFIQTPLPLVISEEYTSNFATAFSLYMVVCGVVSLIFGPLMSFVKSYTGSDTMVIHLLTFAYLTCAISWLVEIVCKKNKENQQINK